MARPPLRLHATRDKGAVAISNYATNKPIRAIEFAQPNLKRRDLLRLGATSAVAYFGEIRRVVSQMKADNTSSARLQTLVQRLHPTWEHTQFIAPALNYLTYKT